MRALILAAGRGSRMKLLTQTHPKCLLTLGDKTLLEWQTQAFLKNGISQISILKGYQKDTLQNPKYQYIENADWAETNMVYSLFCARRFLGMAPHLISYSDIVYHPSIIAKLKDADGEIVITYDQLWESLWEERFQNPLDDAESFQHFDGQLISIGKKTSSVNDIQGQYMGLIKVTPKGWSQMEQLYDSFTEQRKKQIDMTSFLQELLQHGVSISTTPVQGKWCEVDREEDLLLYTRRISEINWPHNWRD